MLAGYRCELELWSCRKPLALNSTGSIVERCRLVRNITSPALDGLLDFLPKPGVSFSYTYMSDVSVRASRDVLGFDGTWIASGLEGDPI